VLSDLKLFKKISSANNEHSNKSEWYKENSQKILTDVSKLYGAESTGSLILGEIGEIFFPHFSMGAINSEKLFNLDELIMTSYYYSSRQKYKKILDLGANIGLHTLLCKKLGFDVVSYEPEKENFNLMEKNNIYIPKGICKNSDINEFKRLINSTIIHEKPLTNYFGENFRKHLTDDLLVDIFKQM
jgi:hypothetical protein